MKIVTTNYIPNAEITNVQEAIFSEQVASINVAKDTVSLIKGMLGGKSQAYSQEYAKARKEALQDLEQQAENMGGNAIINLQVNYNQFINSDIMLIVVTASGTVATITENI